MSNGTTIALVAFFWLLGCGLLVVNSPAFTEWHRSSMCERAQHRVNDPFLTDPAEREWLKERCGWQ